MLECILGMLIVLGIIAVPIGIISFLVWLDMKADDRQHAAAYKLAEEELAREKLKPKYEVNVLTKDGKIHTTAAFEPDHYKDWWPRGHFWSIVSSKSRAETYIEQSFKAGRVRIDDLYIPMCDISEIKPVEVKHG